MFPYCSNPYPSFPPSSSSSSSSSLLPFPFLNPENVSSSHHNNLLHDPIISVPYLPSHHHNIPIPETLNNLALAADNNNCGSIAMPKHDSSSVGVGGAATNYGISCLLTKKPAKKDRHSKIYTSQGLRDRRVRLSIEIARKFFDLQDMLGFDKASNTLDWLFTKSKKAIKELAKSKNNNNNNNNNSEGDGAKSFTSSSECEDCEVASLSDTPNLQQQRQQEMLDGVGGDSAKERKLKRAQKEPACVRANKLKESREKARARARERTSNKICSNNNITGRVQQLELKKKYPATTENPQAFHQSRSQVQHDQDCVRSPNNKLIQPHPHHHHLVGSEAPRDDFNVIEESIVIKRKLKPSLMVSHHHHQNLVAPKEASFNNSNSDYPSFPSSSPNWDANNGASNGRSSFCAIASMNLSTGLQIFGKSWEECTNPRLH